MLVSHSQGTSYVCSCEAVGHKSEDVQASSLSFRELTLVVVGRSRPLAGVRRTRPKSKAPQNVANRKKPAAAKVGARSQNALLDELTAIAANVTGTNISADAPLMDSGLDSIGATELSNKISAHLNTELSPTLLFDHPSLRSIADALSVDHETEE